MSLQYRTRNMWEDRIWARKVRLFRCLFLDAVDRWCKDTSCFPIEKVQASLLRLFSGQTDPLNISEISVRSTLFAEVATPVIEYQRAWPNRECQTGMELIEMCEKVIAGAFGKWESGSMLDPAPGEVAELLIETLISEGYVVFHHRHTTKRDGGGFHGTW